MRSILAAGAAVALILLSSCAPRRAEPAPTPPPPSPVVTPPPQPAPPPLAWVDAPLTQGDWGYDPRLRPRAAFVREGPVFVVECSDTRQIRLARLGGTTTSSRMTIVTTYGERTINAVPQQSIISALLDPSDPLLDEIAFSRGRFLVRADAVPDLILPAWPEIARVIEDCRG